MKTNEWTKKIDADALLITDPVNLRHFTNTIMSLGHLFIEKDGSMELLVDSRYFEAATSTFKNGKVTLVNSFEVLKDKLGKYQKIGIEGNFMTLSTKKTFEGEGRTFVEFNGQELRKVKDEFAINSLRSAATMTKEVMQWASEQFEEGMTENELSVKVKIKLLEMGSETLDYEPIVAFGANTSLPHHKAGNTKLQKGDAVMFDFAAVINGYTADLTRNYKFGEYKHKILEEIYEIVRISQEAGIKAVKAGMTGKEIDKVCRDIIKDAGYGDNFGHGTGHGLGREVHELPSVSFNSIDPFEAGNVITVEPGIYLPGIGGIRIEDDILVKEDGFEVL